MQTERSERKREPWWNKKYGKESICAITQCRLRPGKNKQKQSYVIFLECGHGFYRSVLTQMVSVKSNPNCPLCRKPFDPVIVLLNK